VLRHKLILIALWILAIGFGLHVILSYKGKPGNPGQPPLTLPRNELLAHSPRQPLLLMFAHPRCPCTKASLSELQKLVARAKNHLEIAVLFYEPTGGSTNWSNTALIDQARLIPGVRIGFDQNGNLARRFGIETSGHTLVYGADSKLMFSGGITGSRGHVGDSPGSAAILRIAANPSTSQTRKTTSVFGCELFNQCTRNQLAVSN